MYLVDRSNGTFTTQELARLVASELAPEAIIQQDHMPRPTVAPDRYVPDVTHAARALRLSVRIPLPEAIRRTAGWARLLPPCSERP